MARPLQVKKSETLELSDCGPHIFPAPHKGNALIARRTPDFVHSIKRMRRDKTLREKYICFVFSEIMF
ncbi:hypothetical protein [Bradyrhizobium sp. SZCCHNR2012]|uniref:hypothetical protein n=1 Tax=Bradyrhizobium sp. SZCCHNR2012 TaxID=3057377 RepID=UPI0028E7DEF8|nr:hypothetical protein [Bradyrhizobium sp. SZCCHNR2012]